MQSISIVQAIACYSTASYVDYLRLLLFYHANPNKWITEQENQTCIQDKLYAAKQLKRKPLNNKLRTFKQVPVNVVVSSLPSPLAFPISRADLNGFKLLLPKTAVEDIAFCFAQKSTTSPDFGYTTLLSSEPVILFIDNREFLYKKIIPCMKNGPFLSCCFYPRDPEKLKTQFEMLRLLLETIKQKLEPLDLKQFDEIYQRLFARGEHQWLIKNVIFSYNSFMGCQMLLLAYALRFSSTDEQLMFLKPYYKGLCKNILSSLAALIQGEEYQQRSIIYTTWETQLEEACHKVARKSVLQRHLMAGNGMGTIHIQLPAKQSVYPLQDPEEDNLIDRDAPLQEESDNQVSLTQPKAQQLDAIAMAPQAHGIELENQQIIEAGQKESQRVLLFSIQPKTSKPNLIDAIPVAPQLREIELENQWIEVGRKGLLLIE